MANHAYSFLKNKVSSENVLDLFKKVLEKDIPQFGMKTGKMEREEPDPNEIYVRLEHPSSDLLGITYWFMEDYEREGPRIEVRHGHCFNILWWLEQYVEKRAAEFYGVRLYEDEGIGEYNPKFYSTYEEWNRQSHPSYRNGWDISNPMHVFRLMEIREEAEQMPADMQIFFNNFPQGELPELDFSQLKKGLEI